MKVKPLGRTGLEVSEVGLGTMNFGRQVDTATSFAIMDRADQAGVTLIDTADVYPPPSGPELRGSSEAIVGQWLRARKTRHRMVVATKVGRSMGDQPEDQGLSRQHIMRACEDSLRRLQTDYIDLYQAHAPDPNVPIEETLRALGDLVRQGKVRCVGCSNYSAQQLAEAFVAGDELGLQPFGCVQLRYSLLFRPYEQTLLPFCAARVVGVIAYSPLAGGVLTERPTQAAVEPARGLREFLSTRGRSLTHVALAWVLSQPTITGAIVGASRPEQLVETLGGVGSALDDAEWSACDAVWRTSLGDIKGERQ